MNKPRKALVKKLDETVKQIVRLRDEWTCQKCGKKVKGQDAHKAHVIPASRGYHARWELLNLCLLCFHCHIQGFHGGHDEGIWNWFQAAFPARAKAIEPLKFIRGIKYTDEELETKLEELKKKLKQLKDEQDE